MIKSEIDKLISEEIFQEAQNGFEYWNSITIRQKLKFISTLREIIVDRQKEILQCIISDTSKPITEVVNQEITAVLVMLRFMEKHYPKWLRPRSFYYFKPGFWTKTNKIIYDPIGIIGILGPSNFPFSLPLMQTASALLAGNSVILKPSEKAKETGKILKSIFKQIEFPKGLINVVLGAEEIAKQIITHKLVSKIIFTGSSNTGIKISELCGKYFKPCILELGGNNPAIICEKVDIDICVKSLTWSAHYSTGKSCIGTNIIFVHSKIIKIFLEEFIKQIKKIKSGNPFNECTEISANQNFILPSELKNKLSYIIENANKVYSISESETNDINSENYKSKIVINSTRIEDILNEDFPAPIIFVQSYDSIDRIIELINKSKFGLSVTIWNKNIEEAKNIAGHLRTGMVWINDASVGMPQFAWGGIKKSGWGRLYSQDAVSELTNVKTISADHQIRIFNKPWWFPYSKRKFELFFNVNTLYGKNKIKALLRVLKNLLFNNTI